MELFYAPGSCAFAALASLEHAGASYTPVRLDMAAGDQKSPQFRRVNPLGRVPAMRVEGQTVTELLAVLAYIDARYPAARLLTHADPLDLASEYELLTWFSTTLHLHIAQIFRGERFSESEPVRLSLKENGLQQFREDLVRLDAFCAVAKGPYTSDRFRLTNAVGLVAWRWAQRLELDTSAMPGWSAVISADLHRPAVERAIAVEAAGERWRALDQAA